MKKNFLIALIMATSLTTLSACTTLSRQEKTTLYELKQYGIQGAEETVAHPVVAGMLNILPGCGNFYLAGVSEESNQWLFGFLNLLTWPISVLWGIPEAAIDANTINDRETVSYYTLNPQGQYELQQLRNQYKAHLTNKYSR